MLAYRGCDHSCCREKFLLTPRTGVNLQHRIGALEGQRKGEVALKRDLLRRIKMLEYALRQER